MNDKLLYRIPEVAEYIAALAARRSTSSSSLVNSAQFTSIERAPAPEASYLQADVDSLAAAS